MFRRSLIAAITLLSVTTVALAFDESKYPEWRSQWRRPQGVGIQWDPSKPLGPPQQAKPSGTGGQRRTRQQRHAVGTKTKPSRQAYVSCVQAAQDLAALERCQALLP